MRKLLWYVSIVGIAVAVAASVMLVAGLLDPNTIPTIDGPITRLP